MSAYEAPLSIGAVPHGDGVNDDAMTSGSDTTTSASYVSLAGTGSITSFSFTKQRGDTALLVTMHVTLYATNTANEAMFGVQINSIDYDIVKFYINPATTHHAASGSAFIEGIDAGTYTIQGRWKRTQGTGTLTRDPGDWLSISALEVVSP